MPKQIEVVKGWPDPNSLTKAQLVDLAMALQGILWAGDDGKPDPDKEWSCVEIEEVSETLSRAGLKPADCS